MSQAASGMILQNHRRLLVTIFRVKITAFLEAGYWKDFSLTKKQKVVKTISTFIESKP
jgi:hypothetical protein